MESLSSNLLIKLLKVKSNIATKMLYLSHHTSLSEVQVVRAFLLRKKKYCCIESQIELGEVQYFLWMSKTISMLQILKSLKRQEHLELFKTLELH